MLEIIFYAINELIAVEFLKFSDAGGSIIIHAFGAYFGLALSRTLYTKKALDSPKEGSNYHSDLFAMIGEFLIFKFLSLIQKASLNPIINKKQLFYLRELIKKKGYKKGAWKESI